MTTHDVKNESHRAACEQCAAVWADLELISENARALPVLTPSRDLWAGIESRIGGTGSARAVESLRRRWFSSSVLRLATAASLLVAATASLTWIVVMNRVDARIPAVSVAPSVYEEDFSEMNREIGLLQAVVDDRRPELDPRTVEVLERNLLVIDKAIAESRAAFLNDPASRFLASQLARTYSSKLTLLRQTATMSTGT